MKAAVMFSRVLIVVAGASLLVLAADRLEDTSYVPYDHKAIQYFETPANEAVKRLDDAIDEGKTKLDFAPGFSYLPDLLKRLDINVDSQVLVFAQDSFQASVISPQFPRAIYFNDEYSVGYEPHGEVFELSALDPKQGVMFYSLNMSRAAKPSFGRREVCLQCHQGGQTLGVPGLVISSQYIPKGVEAEHVRGGFVTDDRTPIEDRWGGWFVGGSVTQKNRGVPIGPNIQSPFDAARYLSPDERCGRAAHAGAPDADDRSHRARGLGYTDRAWPTANWTRRDRSWMRRSMTWWPTCFSQMKRR